MKPAKAKTIKTVLNQKVNDWLNSLPADLCETVRKDVIVTGGCITSMLQGVKINDFDIYLKTQSSALALARHYAALIPGYSTVEVRTEEITNIKGETESRVINFIGSSGVAGVNPDDENDASQWLDQPEAPSVIGKYLPTFISQNAITLTDDIQIITRFHGEVDHIHKNFDFVHATCCYDHGTGELTLPPRALESTLSKDLYYTGSLYPIASLFRVKKFIQRGWSITAGEILKIAFQISEIDMTNIATLNDQLTGVDATHMRHLISILQDVDQSKINSSYVATIIDRVFS